ncbi:MAG: hypothetical protein CO108_14570 [Deltaproteobacteria bacterium CG_4_9_14_3_um_filter_63_12]|nr:MAG: hypothetical protein COW42_01295 [Deltaproteobacteria bacterium CG17_big_fil_post_rev_8_21_14_2_50_63_7]PJB40544.1 MAG: hypothetical protein CO108_14570 [Deltaproteobacteria bacterium CG_4_9_14_3_um_filter_63_12]
MALFDKLLGRTWQKFQARADRYVADNELGLALQEYRSAESRFDGNDGERVTLDAAIIKVRGQLREEQLARAKQFVEANVIDRARSALDSAYDHCCTDAERAEVEDQRALVMAVEEGRVVDPSSSAVADGQLELHADDRLSILLGGLESEQSEHYHNLGDDFSGGWLALQEGQFERAIELLERARKETKDDPFVLTELGRAYLALDRNEEAVGVLEKADKAKGESIYIKLHRTQALWAVKDFATAEQVLQSAHDMDEDDHEVFRAIGEHALLSGDYEPGIEAIQLMLTSTPNDISLLRMLGQLNHAAGNLDAALACYEAVLSLRWDLDPETKELVFDPPAALAAASIYLDQGKRPERIIDLLHAMLSVTSGPSASQMYLGIARAHVMKKRFSDARGALSSALALLPEEDEEGRSEVHRRLLELDA